MYGYFRWIRPSILQANQCWLNKKKQLADPVKTVTTIAKGVLIYG